MKQFVLSGLALVALALVAWEKRDDQSSNALSLSKSLAWGWFANGKDKEAAAQGEVGLALASEETFEHTGYVDFVESEWFDHGDDGYGLWLDPAVSDDALYAEHWAGHRAVTVLVEADQIIIRRAGDDDPQD